MHWDNHLYDIALSGAQVVVKVVCCCGFRMHHSQPLETVGWLVTPCLRGREAADCRSESHNVKPCRRD